MNKTRAKYKRLLKDGKEVARPYETETEKGTAVQHFWVPVHHLPKALHEDFPQGVAVVFANQAYMYAVPATEADTDKLGELMAQQRGADYDRFRTFLCAGGDFRLYGHTFKTVMDQAKMAEELAEKEQETIDYAQKVQSLAGVTKAINTYGREQMVDERGEIPAPRRSLASAASQSGQAGQGPRRHASVRSRRRGRRR